jgi:hypothetical protein
MFNENNKILSSFFYYSGNIWCIFEIHESKIETNLLAQIVIKGNLNINSILYKQHKFILNKVPGSRCSLL